MIELKLREDWRARLRDITYATRNEPFAWGQHDCLTFVRFAVLAMTDTDVTKGQFKPYKTPAGAYKQMVAKGFTSLGDAVASVLPERAHISQAQIGDVVSIPDGSELKHALGIVIGERVMVLRNDGVGTVDLLEADRAFKVGT